MMLGAKTDMGGGNGGVPTGGAEVDRVPAEKFDPTANTGTTMGEPMAISPAQYAGENTPRWPEGVDNYDPLNLPAPTRQGPLVSPAHNPTKGSAGRP